MVEQSVVDGVEQACALHVLLGVKTAPLQEAAGQSASPLHSTQPVGALQTLVVVMVEQSVVDGVEQTCALQVLLGVKTALLHEAAGQSPSPLHCTQPVGALQSLLVVIVEQSVVDGVEQTWLLQVLAAVKTAPLQEAAAQSPSLLQATQPVAALQNLLAVVEQSTGVPGTQACATQVGCGVKVVPLHEELPQSLGELQKPVKSGAGVRSGGLPSVAASCGLPSAGIATSAPARSTGSAMSGIAASEYPHAEVSPFRWQ
jgi:hypothetical protein